MFLFFQWFMVLGLFLSRNFADEGDSSSRRLNAVLFSNSARSSSSSIDNAASRAKSEPCVKFGAQFDVPLQGTNVLLDCPSTSGAANKKVCCAAHFPTQVYAINNNTYVKRGSIAQPMSTSRGVGWAYEPDRNVPQHARKLISDTEAANAAAIKPKSLKAGVTCTTKKTYHSSPQELRDMATAHRVAALGTASLTNPAPLADGTKLPMDVHNIRLDALLSYVTSSEMIHNSTKWLSRVKHHMIGADQSSSSEDYEYLSRFEITKTCSNGETSSWTEWIEPVTITARHPLGFSSCKNAAAAHKGLKIGRIGRSNVDYVLLHSGKHLHDASSTNNFKVKKRASSTRNILLDAGTSTFDSSLYWFTCGYSQRGISFDSVHAWEMTMLNPQEYWQKVPPLWKPFWHFYNTPISPDPSHGDSPVRMVQQIATEKDFVAFKLDIDHPDTEMPIALTLLDGVDGGFGSLVDEFFFELHFRCEVMTSCGWGKRVPANSHGLQLDRPTVLQFFIDLRKKGIRAHIWP